MADMDTFPVAPGAPSVLMIGSIMQFSSSLSPRVDSLWVAVGMRIVRWRGIPGSGASPLDLPRLRSALGKHARRLRCPEPLWRCACTSCRDQRRCTWARLFPGSALHEEAARLAPWIIRTEPGSLLTSHFGLEADEFRMFWLALEASLSMLHGRDRGNWRTGPRWLAAELLDGEGRTVLPLNWHSDEAIPMASAPETRLEGQRLSFDVPLILKAGRQDEPPAMGDWLRLGRNRIARLAEQRGYPVWPRDDARWRDLNESAGSARWTWLESRFGTVWPAIPKQHRLIEGWLGTARIDSLPDEWRPWAAVMLWSGVGSKLQFGCGTTTLAPGKVAECPSPAGPCPKISLVWKEGIA